MSEHRPTTEANKCMLLAAEETPEEGREYFDAQDKTGRSIFTISTERLESLRNLLSKRLLKEAMTKRAPVSLIGGKGTPLCFPRIV